MLSQHTIDKLQAMGLNAMADGLRQQMDQAQYAELSFEERLGLLVDREVTWRENRRLQTRLYAAKLRHSATVEEIDFRAPRGLDRAAVLSLAEAGWVTAHHNLLLTGATGCGKSFVACALAHAAIRAGHAALDMRTPRLLSDLALARGDGRYPRLLNKLARTELLVLDDFLLTPVSSEEAKDLLEITEDRNQLRSTMVVSQLPVDSWHQAIPDPTLADAILDRLVQNAHRVVLKGGSMRRRQPESDPVA